jgi:hypothetical protein
VKQKQAVGMSTQGSVVGSQTKNAPRTERFDVVSLTSMVWERDPMERERLMARVTVRGLRKDLPKALALWLLQSSAQVWEKDLEWW